MKICVLFMKNDEVKPYFVYMFFYISIQYNNAVHIRIKYIIQFELHYITVYLKYSDEHIYIM